MYMKYISQLFFSFAVFALAAPVVVFAQLKNPLKGDITTIAGFTEAFLRAVTFILFPIAVLFIVYSGFLFVFARGDIEMLKKAKINFLWTVIGVALLLGAWALAVLIQGTIDPILGR